MVDIDKIKVSSRLDDIIENWGREGFVMKKRILSTLVWNFSVPVFLGLL